MQTDNFSLLYQRSKHRLRRIETQVSIGGHMYVAIWDTGSTKSAISERVVSDLDLVPIREVETYTGSGLIATKEYSVTIDVTERMRIADWSVNCLNLSPNEDVLLGMDLISLGEFVISNADNGTEFKFAIRT